jgi:cold shock CspA family protein/uncharacterized LabA/DUF88 family protein
MNSGNSELVRIGIFYEGNYFLHVSNYYNYIHSRKRRLSISGIHDFIRQYVASREKTTKNMCHVVESHYFRGRLSAQEASQRANQLYYDRVFDDILMSEGVLTHYMPLRGFGRKEEKGIECWLSLEAYDYACQGKFDVVVLISADGDYIPLCKKLNAMGIRVMVLYWEFDFTDETGLYKETRVAHDLLQQVSYPVAMHELIDSGDSKQETLVNNLFVGYSSVLNKIPSEDAIDELPPVGDGILRNSTILSLKSGFGFIAYPPNNLFFHFSDIVEGDYSEIQEGDEVEFVIERNERGQDVAKQVKKLMTM